MNGTEMTQLTTFNQRTDAAFAKSDMADAAATQAVRLKLEAGRDLAQAKADWEAQYGGNGWVEHLESRRPGGYEEAARLIAVSKKFCGILTNIVGVNPNLALPNFTVLAELSKAPDAVVTEALETLAAGNPLTADDGKPLTAAQARKKARTASAVAKVPEVQEVQKALDEALKEKAELAAQIAKLDGSDEIAGIQEKLDHWRKQETAMDSAIRTKQEQLEVLTRGAGSALAHKKAVKSAHEKMQSASIAVSELFDDDDCAVPAKIRDEWYRLADNLNGFASYIRKKLEELPCA